MGQKLGAMSERIQGKRQVLVLCDKVFDRYAQDDLLCLTDLHLATLLVFDSVNNFFPKPHKSPPSQEEIDDVVTDHSLRAGEGKNAMSRAEFSDLILRWMSRDLAIYLRNKTLHIIAAAGAMVALTRNAAKTVPRIGLVVDKIPAPIIASAYAVCFAMIEDVRVE